MGLWGDSISRTTVVLFVEFVFGIGAAGFDVDLDACEFAAGAVDFAGGVGVITSGFAGVVLLGAEADVVAVDVVIFKAVVVVTGSRYSTCKSGAAVGFTFVGFRGPRSGASNQ